MTTVTRRTAILSTCAASLGLSACSSSPPMDEGEVNDAVGRVEGVTSVAITVETNGGTSGWWLAGEIGLPDGAAEAKTVYENCLRAIASVPTRQNLGINVYGASASGEVNPPDVGAPDNTTRLKEHFT